MASILDKYGIKEVADVTFYEINKTTGKPEAPVLYLDTLKVSTIEQTAENVEARGGKGNTALISWDYNKEINVTLEDALFSAKSMAIMFGDGKVDTTETSVLKTIEWTATSTATEASEAGAIDKWKTPNGKYVTIPTDNVTYYDETGASVTSFTANKKYFMTFDQTIKDSGTITISADSFPGTYYITGDTYARSNTTNADEFFQFIIPKAKVAAENSITLEAEGDPSVFNLNLRVLRPDDGVMMKLVKYDVTTDAN